MNIQCTLKGHEWKGCVCMRCARLRHEWVADMVEKPCAACGGAGRIKPPLSYGDPEYGNPGYEGEVCGTCGGTGQELVEAVPATFIAGAVE